ncbi:MAG: hypothetical protein U0V70_14135 [Terriglobia bacterium]
MSCGKDGKGGVVVLIAALLLGHALPLRSQTDYLKESEKKAHDVLSNAIEAMGGEAYYRMQTLHRVGRFYQFRKDQLKGGSHFQTFEKFPGKLRFEIGKKGELVNINDGDKGWKIEYKVVKNQTPQEIENYQLNLVHTLDYVLRFRLKEPGMRIRYLGKSHVENREIEGVQLIDKDNDKIKIYVDTANNLPYKMEFRAPGFGIFEPTDDERIFYNYHVSQGVQIPYSTERYSNGFKASEFQVESVEVDLPLPDAFFTPEYSKK